MNNITTTPIKENGKTVAYVIPAKAYERYQVLEELDDLENTEFAKIAKQSLKSWYAREEETNALFADILK